MLVTSVLCTDLNTHPQAPYNNVTDGKKDIRVYDYQADPENLGVTVPMAWNR